MQTNIHPKQFEVAVSCSGCGNKFKILSTRDTKTSVIEFCDNCHKAWKKGGFQVAKNEKITAFNEKFDNLFSIDD